MERLISVVLVEMGIYRNAYRAPGITDAVAGTSGESEITAARMRQASAENGASGRKVIESTSLVISAGRGKCFKLDPLLSPRLQNELIACTRLYHCRCPGRKFGQSRAMKKVLAGSRTQYYSIPQVIQPLYAAATPLVDLAPPF